jgi:hypothetical protein
MSNEVTVMNWFFGITAGLAVLSALSSLWYTKIKKQKVERPPILLIFQIGYAGCAVAIMNLRDNHEGLAIALSVVQVILVAIVAPMSWRRFVKHLRDEGLIAKKRED